MRRPRRKWTLGHVETQVLGVFTTHLVASPKRVAEVAGLARPHATSCLNRLYRSGQVSKAGSPPLVDYFMTPAQRAAL